jgi:hypothetical protein
MRIARIIEIRDTRDFDYEVDAHGEEVLKPVPGTGDPHDCDRCGRAHEVHATVELDDGSLAMVGSACANAGDGVSPEAFRSGAALATRIAKLRREVSGLDTKLAGWRAAEAEVDAMQAPELTTKSVRRKDGGETLLLTCGDGGDAWCRNGVTDERRQCAIGAWRRMRLAELGFSHPVHDDGNLRRRLARAEEKMSRLVHAPSPAA